MFVDIIITGRLNIDPDDLEKLKKEPVSTLGAVLQNNGREVETQIIEVKEKPAESRPVPPRQNDPELGEEKSKTPPAKKGK